MSDIKETKKLLDEINAAVASYDPVLKESARDILLKQAFGTEVAKPNPSQPPTRREQSDDSQNAIPFHGLVDKWTPGNEAEWALLGAYYCQEVLGQESFTAFEVNKLLKNHGNPIANITMAFTASIDTKPALIRQTAKSGSSKQARKKYVVTTVGVKTVQDRLSGKASATGGQ